MSSPLFSPAATLLLLAATSSAIETSSESDQFESTEVALLGKRAHFECSVKSPNNAAEVEIWWQFKDANISNSDRHQVSSRPPITSAQPCQVGPRKKRSNEEHACSFVCAPLLASWLRRSNVVGTQLAEMAWRRRRRGVTEERSAAQHAHGSCNME